MHPSRTAFLSVISNTFVVSLKFVVGLVTGSVAILSEAIHSFLDLAASVIAFFSVRFSGRSADRNHPYGHGKIENISGTIETLLIFVAGLWIIYECIHKLLHPEPIHLPWLGVGVMLVGATINFIVSRRVSKVAEETHSMAMKSNALHLLTDVYTSLGVAVSLILVTFTGWYILDPLIGIVLAIYIMKEAYHLTKESFPPLLDASLTEEEEKQITTIVQKFSDHYLEVHDLRTRRSGPNEFIDFHLVLATGTTIEAAHHLCDEIEQAIKSVFNRAHVFIHVEPEHEKVHREEVSSPLLFGDDTDLWDGLENGGNPEPARER